MLVCRFIQCKRGLLVDSQHRLFAIPFDMNQVPEVIIERVRRHLLQRLNSVANVKPELNNVAN